MKNPKEHVDLGDDDLTYDDLTENESVLSGSVNDVLDNISENPVDLDEFLKELAIPQEFQDSSSSLRNLHISPVQMPTPSVTSKIRVNMINPSYRDSYQSRWDMPPPTPQDTPEESPMHIPKPLLVRDVGPKVVIERRNPLDPPSPFDPRKQDYSIVKLNRAKPSSKLNKSQSSTQLKFNEDAMTTSDKMINEYMDKVHSFKEKDLNNDSSKISVPKKVLIDSRDNILASEFMKFREEKFGLVGPDGGESSRENPTKPLSQGSKLHFNSQSKPTNPSTDHSGKTP